MMRDSPQLRLSQADWLVLCVAAEKPAHGVLGIQGHLLDEAELVGAVQAEPEQAGCLVVVDAAHISTAFTFTGASPPPAAAARPARTSGSRSRRASSLNVSRDKVSSDTFSRSSPAAASGPASRASPMPLVVSEISGPRVQRRRGGDKAGQAAAQEWSAAGEPDLGDA